MLHCVYILVVRRGEKLMAYSASAVAAASPMRTYYVTQ